MSERKNSSLVLPGVGLVLHVLQQNQAQRHIANAVKAHQVHRPSDTVLMLEPRESGHCLIDAQQFVGQRDRLSGSRWRRY